MKILVTGGSGQLARAISQAWQGDEIVLLDRRGLDLGSRPSIIAAMRGHRPEAVINAGAHTQVDLCESEPERALLLNGTAVGWLAEACAETRSLLVQISTDYVFDGLSRVPYREDDPTSPQSVYGRTKLEGERLAAQAPEHLVVRTSWLYDAWGKNFYTTMRTMAAEGRPLKVVDDQTGSPTSCRALARQLQAAVREGWRGTLHATCAGETTWHGFAAEIFRGAGLHADLSPCATSDFPRPARRPPYSVLDGARRKAWGVDVMPPWQDALREVAANA